MFPKVISIDPPRASDLDDAIAATPLPGNRWKIDVCLPDVPKHIRPGSQVDLKARQQGETLYGPEGVRVSMMGNAITDNITLAPEVTRDMIHIEMELDENLDARVMSIERIHGPLLACLTYGQADKIIHNPGHNLYGYIKDLWTVTRRLHARRVSKTGAIFDIENKVFTNEEGQIVKMDSKSAHKSNLIVMELMILTNVTLAKYANMHGKPILYRNHHLEGFNSGKHEDAAFELAQKRSISIKQASQLVRSMGHSILPAEMGTTPKGHYGLDVEAYAWFTSPLRRYCDIVNLRAVLDDHHDNNLQELASYLTILMRNNREISGKHHGEVHRKKLIRFINNEQHNILDNSDVHTIIRSMLDNGNYDREKAETYIWRRLEKHDVSPRDIESLTANGKALLGHEFLEKLEKWIKENPQINIIMNIANGEKPGIVQQHYNFKGMLLERAAAVGGQVIFHPVSSSGPSNTPVFSSKVEWRHKNGDLIGTGYGLRAKQAENSAAKEILDKLGRLPFEEKKAIHDNPKGNLLEYAAKNKGKAVFEQTGKYGPDHAPVFGVQVTYTCKDEIIIGKGTGKSIKDAERQASQMLLEKLLVPE